MPTPIGGQGSTRAAFFLLIWLLTTGSIQHDS